MHSAQRMYDLINDVERYPEFLPWCVGTAVESQTELEMVATVKMRSGLMKQAFTTRNELVPGKQITMNLVKGPFRQLSGVWRFAELEENACKVSLDLRFEVVSSITGSYFSKMFLNEVANKMVDTFCKRADVIYE